MTKDLKSSNTGEIINPNIVSENIPSGAVTTDKLNDASVTTAKIKDSAVTSGKINDGAVNYDKLATALKNLINGKASSEDLTTLQNALTSHTGNTSNPHNVTKAQVGLTNVVDKPMDNTPTNNSDNYVKSGGVYDALLGKQPQLVSGQNIKTINGQSILGSGDLPISGGSDIGFITLNNASGTLTDEQYNECLKTFCIIKYIKASNEIEYLIKNQDLNTDTSSNAQFFFYGIRSIYGNNILLQSYECEINQNNKSYNIIYENKESYTKNNINNLLNDKQNTLTAGTGIQIQNNVISATGGGSSLYHHAVSFYVQSDYYMEIHLDTSSNTQFTFNSLMTYLCSLYDGILSYPCLLLDPNEVAFSGILVFIDTPNFSLKYWDGTTFQNISFTDSNVNTFSDTITAL